MRRTLIAREAVGPGITAHRLVAPPSVGHVALVLSGFFNRIRLPVGPADETLERRGRL
ncbi:MAG: hypothetical protein KJO57_01395 [Deltaproteobacteria bacterium]|nr:hypothetical protein [Deltaproteobacteria bacterium]